MSLATQITALATRIGQEVKLLMRSANNLSDVQNRQTALNNLTAVSGATNETVLTKDTSTGNAIWKVSAGGGGASDVSVAQTGHGLSVGNAIRVSGTNSYAKAQADSASNAEVVGYVTVVTDANNFKYIPSGIVTTGVPVQSAGTVMFLDPSTAGALTATEPTTAGQVSKPLLIVLESGTKAVFMNFRGLVISSGGSGAGSSSIISANTTAVKDTLYVLTANLTLTLPSAPMTNDKVYYSNLSGVTTCTVARNGNKIMGLSEDLTLDKLNSGGTFWYTGSAQGWIIL